MFAAVCRHEYGNDKYVKHQETLARKGSGLR